MSGRACSADGGVGDGRLVSLWHEVGADGRRLFVTRAVRLFANGCLSVSLGLYLGRLGLSPAAIGLVLTAGLAGGAAATLGLGAVAHRIGRRRALVLTGVATALGAVLLATGRTVPVLALATAIASTSPTGQDVGPQPALEQAGIAGLVGGARRTDAFAWYSLVGSLALALGSLAAGATGLWHVRATVPLAAYELLIAVYGLAGLLGSVLYARCSPGLDGPAPVADGPRPLMGLHRSRGVVALLAGLFSVDAFAGGIVAQGLVAYYFHLRFGLSLAALGPLFFATSLAAAGSYLAAARLARRFGLLNTMVFTHLPSNFLLMLVAAMPVWPLAALVLFLRNGLSQMDVPTRQAYLMALVTPEERSAAAGATGSARTAGAMLGPLVGGVALASPVVGLPLLLGGGLKAVYDVALYLVFRRVRLPDEAASPRRSGDGEPRAGSGAA